MKKIKQLSIKFFLSIAIIIFVLAILFVLIIKDTKDIFIFNYKPYIIASGSMEPEYKIHSLVIIKKGGYEKVKVGDVIAFRPDAIIGKNAFHRVVEITKQGLITKGDNNDNQDIQIITKETYVGKEYFHTNLPAFFISIFLSPMKFLLYIVLSFIALILFVIALKILLKKNIDVKKNS